MGDYVQVGAVRTWYGEHGRGRGGVPLVLLHPGGADARAFGPTLPPLAESFRVLTPDRRGHGRTPDVDGPISYELMAEDTVGFIEAVAGGPAHLLGCSDGATVALLAALRRPDLVDRLALVAGVFHHDGWVPRTAELDEASAEALAAAHDEVSPDGPGGFQALAAKLDRMHAHEPALRVADLARVRSRTLVMVGDDDEVTLEHAVAMYRGILDAELAVVPGTSHGLLVEKPGLCNTMLVDFFAGEPVETFAPVRREWRA